MKKNFIKSLLALAVVFSAASCELNDYNEQNLDGYESDKEITDIQTINLELTADDYASLANKYNTEAIEIADMLGCRDELAAVGSTMVFTNTLPADKFIPVILGEKYNTYLDKGSKALVTYRNADELPEVHYSIVNAEEYELTEADYVTAWGDGSETPYFTAGTPADANLPAILKAAFPVAAEGDYKVVSYQYSVTEPATGGNGGSTGGNGDGGDTGGDGGNTGGGDVTTDTEVTLNATSMGITAETAADYDVEVDGYGFTVKQGSFSSKFSNFIFQALGYLESTTALEGLKSVKIVGTNNYKNIHVFAGADAASAIEVESIAEEGTQYAMTYTYDVPAGSTYVKLINTNDGYTAYFVDVVLTLGGDGNTGGGSTGGGDDNTGGDSSSFSNFTLDSETLGFKGEADYAGTATVGGIEFEMAGLSSTDSFGSTYVDYENGGFIKNTTAFTGLQSITVEGNGYVKTNLVVEVGATADALTVVESTSEAGSGWGSKYDYTIPSDAQFIKFSANPESGHDAGISNISFVFEGGSSAPAKVAAALLDRKAIYAYTNGAWAPAANADIINKEEYVAMGSNYGNLSSTMTPEIYLPVYLAAKYPYAVDGNFRDVSYQYYDATSKKTTTNVSRVNFVGGDWVVYDNIKTVSDSPYEFNGSKWAYNPSMIVYVYPDKANQASQDFYYAGFNYVKDTYGSGDESKGHNFTPYDNTEYYSGFSAYNCNVTWRYSDLKKGWGTDFDQFDVTAEEAKADPAVAKARVKALYDFITPNTIETMTNGLGRLYPDVEAVAGLDVVYTVKFFAFIGIFPTNNTTTSHEAKFKIVGKGQFEYIEDSFKCTDSKYDYYSDANVDYVIATYQI